MISSFSPALTAAELILDPLELVKHAAAPSERRVYLPVLRVDCRYDLCLLEALPHRLVHVVRGHVVREVTQGEVVAHAETVLNDVTLSVRVFIEHYRRR